MDTNPTVSNGRRNTAIVILITIAVALCWRSVQLQTNANTKLQAHGKATVLRVVDLPAHRGTIVDRNGEPLAVSTPVKSAAVDPGKILAEEQGLQKVATALGIKATGLREKLQRHADREFVYIKRHLQPSEVQRLTNLSVPGVSLIDEYRRFYPAGEIFGHVLGFTDIDDTGQEGLELAYDQQLRGEPGKKRVLKNALGQIVEEIELLQEPKPGARLHLTLDKRIQYLAYRELARAVKKHDAASASAVVLDVRSGDILAVVNQPVFNPNSRHGRTSDRYRNRAVTDLFEPGSTIKPFIVAAALASGKVGRHQVIDTNPGFVYVGKKRIEDKRNLGVISLTELLQRSSNVGASKLALSLDDKVLWQTMNRLGFGAPVSIHYPGEQAGFLRDYYEWRKIDKATLSYGYGLSVTTLQLARAYAVLANGGVLPQLRLHEDDRKLPAQRVFAEETVRAVSSMLTAVVSPEGTAEAASIPGFQVAGKTGTVQKLGQDGYEKGNYVSLFAGFAPQSAPRIVVVVVVDQPSGKKFYGGDVAAPVFAEIAAETLRLLDVPPDDLRSTGARIVRARDGRIHAQHGNTATTGSL